MRTPVTLALLAALAPTSPAQNWTRQFPTTDPDVLDVATDGAGTVVAVGNAGTVLRSSDAGVTWTQHNTFDVRLNAVEFLSGVVLAGGDGLYRSLDGGLTFLAVHPATGVQAIEAVSATEAWAVTSDGYALHSLDQGRTWSILPLPSSWFGAAHTISFETPLRGWIGGQSGQMLATVDGGATWTPVQGPTNDTLFGMQRGTGAANYLLEGDGVYRGLMGAWTYSLFPWVTNARDFQLLGNFGVAVGLSGRVMVSPNAGANWIFAFDDGGHEHEGVVILDALVAIVVGEDGRILRTADAGSSWTTVRGGAATSSPWIRGLAAVDSDTLLAACTDGKVLRTDNAGGTWATLQAGTPQTHFRGVSSFDGIHLYAVGERQGFYPTFCHSTDGGLNWTERNQLGMYDIYDVRALSATTAVASSDTRIWRTTDGGSNWSSVTPVPYSAHHALDFIDASRGWTVGTEIFRSVDGGLTWVHLATPPQRAYDVDFLDANVGWLVGASGMIQHTIDGGVTWQSQSSGTASRLSAISVAAAGLLVAAGDGGVVLISNDNGASWLPAAPTSLSGDPIHASAATSLGFWIAGDLDAGIWSLGSGNTACTVANYCTAKVHSLGGVASMRAFGLPSATLTNIGVGTTGALPSTFGLSFLSEAGAAASPLWNGTLCVQAPLTRLPVVSFDASGFAYYNVPITSSMVGSSRWYQMYFRDPNALDGTGIGMADGLMLTFCP